MVHAAFNVVRVASGLEGGAVAGEAVGGSPVVAALVALRAVGCPVRSGERKARPVMVYGGRFPSHLRMTGRAVVVVVPVHMRRVSNALEVRQVAGIAVRGRAVEARRMTLRASHRLMGSLQGEAGLVVINSRRFPPVGGMARCAVMIVMTGDVAWVPDGLEGRGMAIEASLGSPRPTSSDMAESTVNLLMPAGQLEAADVVIE